jgi:hypothetical protein
MKETRAVHLTLSLVLLLLFTSRVLTAEGWREYRAGRVEIKIPYGWSCNYDAARQTIAATSDDGQISFKVLQRRLEAGQTLPSSPARLKEYLNSRYELLNATDGTQYDVTTKNISVETINNLRGVVAELTQIVPAKKEDGSLYLKKFKGFVLVAVSQEMFYSAIILCPVGSYTYHSALMNRVVNDLRADDSAAQTTNARRIVRTLSGDWQLSDADGLYRMRLSINGDQGTMRVYWRDKSGESYQVSEQLTLAPKLYGTLAVGANPVYLSQNRSHPKYAPDTLLFQRQADDSFKVLARDDVYVNEWKPLRVESYAPQAPLSSSSFSSTSNR